MDPDSIISIPHSPSSPSTLPSDSSTRAVYGFLNGHTINDQIARQWVVECSANISTDIIPEYSKIEESCLSTRVYDILNLYMNHLCSSYYYFSRSLSLLL